MNKTPIEKLLLSLVVGGGMVFVVSQITKAREPAPEVLKYEFKIISS